VESAPVFLAILHCFEESRIFEESAVLDGEGDAGEVLIDDATGTKGHVTHFAVPGGIPGESDGDARCLEGDHGIESAHLVESRELAFLDGVTLYGIGESPTIEDDEDDGFVCFHVFLKIVSRKSWKIEDISGICVCGFFHHSLLALLRGTALREMKKLAYANISDPLSLSLFPL
jgi:hypothetical protein